MGKNLSQFHIPDMPIDKNFLKQELAKGKTFQELMGFSDEALEKLTKTSYSLLHQKNYTDAFDGFLFLVMLNPNHYENWIGLGVSAQHCKEYEAAIDAFERAAICNIESPEPYFHLADCLFALHDRKAALAAIELAIEYAEEGSGYQALYEQAQKAKQALLRQL